MIFILELLALLFILFLIIQTFKLVLYIFYLWQIAEYRPDRLFSRLQNKGDKKELYSYLNFLNLFPPNKYPKITLRILLTFILLIPIYYQLFFFIYRNLLHVIKIEGKLVFTLFLVLLILYYLSALIISLLTLLFSLVLLPIKKYIIFLAKKKLENHSNVVAVGITGSYGKSSTKNIIAEVLSLKYKVVKTPANINTQLGVAKTILQSVKADTQFFVVEMGAYKIGEIQAICNLTNPKAAVITGINSQHLSLFGSMTNILKAKYELIKALPDSGAVFFNAKDSYCLSLHKKTRIKQSFLYGSKTEEFKEAVDAGVLLGKFFQVPAGKIKKVLPKLKRLMELKRTKSKNGLMIFDDSYSANPNGFVKALKTISSYKRKKIIITPGIIELGKNSDKIHRLLGKQMSETGDKIVITNCNYYDQILSAVKKEDKKKFLLTNNPFQIQMWLREKLNRRWLVLIEGRVPMDVKNFFLKG